jgi:Spy/CpxP family protein refolding chaperone
MGRGGGGGDMGASMGGGGMMPRRQSRLDMLADKLKLKSDQKSEVENILSAAMEKAGPVREELTQARRAVAEAILRKASDEEIKKTLDSYAEVSGHMAGIEADAFGKIYALLKPNQQGKAAQAFELMAGMFAGGGGGGMGRRGNRGGGE